MCIRKFPKCCSRNVSKVLVLRALMSHENAPNITKVAKSYEIIGYAQFEMKDCTSAVKSLHYARYEHSDVTLKLMCNLSSQIVCVQ